MILVSVFGMVVADDCVVVLVVADVLVVVSSGISVDGSEAEETVSVCDSEGISSGLSSFMKAAPPMMQAEQTAVNVQV